ncbi:hypothetical protein OROHE_002112 [Orobanche hederae]
MDILPSARNFWRKVDAFYRFTRPHTIIGSIVGVTSVSLLPLVSVGDLSAAFFIGLLKVMIPIVCANIYVVGLNQVYDVEIDKVNKPNLPIASGEFSMGMGKAIVSAFGLMFLQSIIMGIMSQSPPVPLFRWKKNAFLAAMCIVIVRAITVQLTVFYHIQQYVLGRPVLLFSRSLAFAIICMTLFVTVIALFKDIPDVDGDRDFGIQTISVALGKKRFRSLIHVSRPQIILGLRLRCCCCGGKVFWLCISILLIAYGSAVVIGASSSLLLSKLVTVTGHCILASVLWFRANTVNLDSNASITSFYMFIWKLFYTEYLLIPFVR